MTTLTRVIIYGGMLLVGVHAFAVNLPTVKATKAVAPEIKTLLLEDIFLGDRLKMRSTDKPLAAKLKNALLSPKHAIYSSEAAKFIDRDARSPKLYHGKIVLYKVGDTWEIGVASKLTHKGVNVKEEVLVNNYRVNVKDIGGVLLWNSPLYGTTKHLQPLSVASLMYVIETPNQDLIKGANSGKDYDLLHYQSDDTDAHQPRLPDGTTVQGMVIATFTDGSKLAVGEHYRNSDRIEWQAALEDEPLQVYLIK